MSKLPMLLKYEFDQNSTNKSINLAFALSKLVLPIKLIGQHAFLKMID